VAKGIDLAKRLGETVTHDVSVATPIASASQI
jgi:hypothetical protein